MNATKIKIKSGAINNNALIFCCRRERFRLFFNGVPSADKSTFVEELLTIKVSFSHDCIKSLLSLMKSPNGLFNNCKFII